MDYSSIFALCLFTQTISLCTRFDQVTWIWRPKNLYDDDDDDAILKFAVIQSKTLSRF